MQDFLFLAFSLSVMKPDFTYALLFFHFSWIWSGLTYCYSMVWKFYFLANTESETVCIRSSQFWEERLTQSTSRHLSALKAKLIYNAELISKNTKRSYTTLWLVDICCRPWGIILIDFQEKSRSVLLMERKSKCFEVLNWAFLTGNFQLFSFSGALTIDRY